MKRVCACSLVAIMLMTASWVFAETVKITYIPQNTGNAYFDRIYEGFQEGCQEAGCEVLYIGPASTDATSQIPIIQEQVQQGIDSLAIQPNSVDALNTIFDEVRAKGVTIIANNVDITNNEEHRDAAVLAIDLDDVGRALIEEMGKLIDYEGEFAILSATADAPVQRHYIEDPGGIKDLLQNEPKYAKMALVEVAYGDDVPQKSTTEMEALLAKYPDLKGVISPTSVGISAAAQVLESMGDYPEGPTGRNIQLTGLGLPSQLKSFVLDGILPNFILWDPADVGYANAFLAVGLKNGTISLGEGNTFQAGRLGELTFGKNNIVICGPPLAFTKDNIETVNF